MPNDAMWDLEVEQFEYVGSFTMVPNQIIESDWRISFKAVGLYNYIISRPPRWRLCIKDMANKHTDGESAIVSGLAELEAAGWIRRERKRNEKGQHCGTKITAYKHLSVPIPDQENPCVENPRMDNPRMENSAHNNIQRTNTEEIKTKEEDPPLISPPLFPDIEEPKPKRKKRTPVSEDMIQTVRLEWNSFAEQHGLPRTLVLDSKRERSLRDRLATPWWVENWQAAMLLIPDRPFLMGKNDRRWKADFDWFVKENSVLNLIEGTKYIDRHAEGVYVGSGSNDCTF